MSCDSAVVESVDRQRFVVVEWKMRLMKLMLMIVDVVVVLLLLFLLLLVLVVWTLRKASFEFASEFAFEFASEFASERDKRVVIVVWHGFADVVYLKRSILVVASVSEL